MSQCRGPKGGTAGRRPDFRRLTCSSFVLYAPGSENGKPDRARAIRFPARGSARLPPGDGELSRLRAQSSHSECHAAARAAGPYAPDVARKAVAVPKVRRARPSLARGRAAAAGLNSLSRLVNQERSCHCIGDRQIGLAPIADGVKSPGFEAPNLFASPGAFDPSRVDAATGRAYRSWRRRPPSSCPPRPAFPSSRRLFSPL